MKKTLEESVEFVNAESRLACALVLDTSYSMSENNSIDQLNEGLGCLAKDLKEDSAASARVELCVITFGGDVRCVREFSGIRNFEPPVLTPRGVTPMGKAVDVALTRIKARQNIYRRNRINHYKPWLFLLTDGYPTDDNWQEAAARLRAKDQEGQVNVFAIGVEQADFKKLAKFSAARQPARLSQTKFKELFVWLSQSLRSVSQSQPGEDITLPSQEPWTEKIRI